MTEPSAVKIVHPSSEIIRAARLTARLTQDALAMRLRTSQTIVSQAELGKREVSPEFLERVLKACKLPAWWTP